MDGQYHKTYHCQFRPVDGAAKVTLEWNSEEERARYGNLLICSRVWTCAYCSAMIHARRREELMQANHIMEHEGYYIFMLTLTLAHDASMTLKQSFGALSGAYSKARAGRQWKEFRESIGYEFDVTATEITVSNLNGWHPHKHVLMYLNKSVVDRLRECDPEIPFATYDGVHAAQYLLEKWFTKKWLHWLGKHGYSASEQYGVHVTLSDRKIAEYVAKYGYLPQSWGAEDELVRSNGKRGKSVNGVEHFNPVQLLMAFALDGDEWAGDRWLEYALATYRKPQLRYSDGFKRFLKIHGLDVLSDAEIAEMDEDSPNFHVLAHIPLASWQQIIDDGLQGLLIDYVKMTEGNEVLVKEFLSEHGISVTAGSEW